MHATEGNATDHRDRIVLVECHTMPNRLVEVREVPELTVPITVTPPDAPPARANDAASLSKKATAAPPTRLAGHDKPRVAGGPPAAETVAG